MNNLNINNRGFMKKINFIYFISLYIITIPIVINNRKCNIIEKILVFDFIYFLNI